MTLKTVNQAGRCLIGHNEGFSLTSYPDGVGVWTIGWGTTRINGKPVTENMTITYDEAVVAFNHDIAYFEKEVSRLVTVPLTNNHFAALVSFIYNVGAGAFQKSTLLKKLNAKDYVGAANEFSRWIYADKKILPGLVTRREKEKNLFLTPDP